MTRDYVRWHDDYDRPGSRLHLRLLVVRDLLDGIFDEQPAGPIRAISMCAGQGRDLLTVASRHHRGTDVTGRLVELDPENVAAGRRAIAVDARLAGLEMVEGDASSSDLYADAVPADVVLACGIFGNISEEDIERTIAFLPRLCGPGARVLWTRDPKQPGIIDAICGWFADAGFRTDTLVTPPAPADFGVGLATLEGDPQPFVAGEHLFTFLR